MARNLPPPEDPSGALLRRWQGSGDREALDELLRIEISVLKSRIRARGGEMAQPSISVSDVAQDAVMRLLRVEPAPRFETTESLRAYLWLSAWRLLVESLRRPGQDAVRLEPADTGKLDGALSISGGLSGVEARDRNVSLAVVVNLLEPPDQQILDLVYFKELGIEGASKELGIGYDAAKMRLVRARKHLAEKLEGWAELIG